MIAETNEVDSAVSDAAFYLVPVLTDELQSLAIASNWPARVIKQITVSFDGASLYIDYPDDIAQEIQDLEYGKTGQVPNSVLRSFVYKIQPLIKEFYKDHVASNLFDLEEIYA